jgi:hypothetical protein
LEDDAGAKSASMADAAKKVLKRTQICMSLLDLRAISPKNSMMKCLFTIFLLLFLSFPSMILALGTPPEAGASKGMLTGSGAGILCYGPTFSMALDALPTSHPLRQARDEEALIQALRQVPDRESMEFMTAFNRNWLEGKMPNPDAFRKAQREMRVRFFRPYSWAGFVLIE